MSILFTIHLAATLAMVGIIWSVQWVQYPLFAEVERAHFSRYHEAHVHRIGGVVAPLMVVEALTAFALLWQFGPAPTYVAAVILLAVVWLSTFAVQVPLHRKLAASFNPAHVRSLVRGNWIRTVGWTARAVLLLSAIPSGASQ